MNDFTPQTHPAAPCTLGTPIFDLYLTPALAAPTHLGTRLSYELPANATTADKEIRRHLIRTQTELSESGACVQMVLPQNGNLRIRDIISRASMRPTFKFPSMTQGRPIHCESQLEHDGALLFDASYLCSALCEQPFALHFTLDGEVHRHIPDFVFLLGNKLVIVEYKYSRTITKADLVRTRYLQAMLGIRHIDYQLLTESDVNDGHRLDNAKKLLRRGRQPQATLCELECYETLRRNRVMPLAEFGWDVLDSAAASSIAKLILDGRAVLERNEPLSALSRVRISDIALAAQGESA